MKVSRPPTGVPRDVDVATHSGNQRVTGYFFPFDHLPGGILLYPPTENVREVAFDWAGQRHVAK